MTSPRSFSYPFTHSLPSLSLSPPHPLLTGAVKASDIRDHLTENTALVTIMHSNNEVGTLQPLKEIARHVHTFNTSKRSDVLLHTDAGEQSMHG